MMCILLSYFAMSFSDNKHYICYIIIMLYYVKNGFELHLMIPTHFSIGFDDRDQDEERVDCVQ